MPSDWTAQDIEAQIKKYNYSIEIGGKTADELEESLRVAPFSLDEYAQEMMRSQEFGVLAASTDIRVTRVMLGNIGFAGVRPTIGQIADQISQVGLEFLPAEAGPHLRLQDTRQLPESNYYVAMQPIGRGPKNDPFIFRLYCPTDHKFCLWARFAGSAEPWENDRQFVFRVRE